MTDDTALPRLPPLTDGDLAATEVLALRGSKFGWREVLRLVRDLRAARAALSDLFGLVEDGTLCRDTSRDSEPGWAIKMLPVVAKLKAAQEIVRPGGPSGEENRG